MPISPDALIWVTRPEPAATRTAERLRILGFTPIVAPILEEVPVAYFLPDPLPEAIVFTSQAAPKYLAPHLGKTIPASLPVYCVGAQTTDLAREVGFTQAQMLGEDAASLIAALSTFQKKPASLLYLSGERSRYDLAAELAPHGILVEQRVVYSMQRISHLPEALRMAWDQGRISALLLYSPYTAQIALETLGTMPTGASAPELLCLSSAVAEVAAASGLPVSIATRPTEVALLALLDEPKLDAEAKIPYTKTPPSDDPIQWSRARMPNELPPAPASDAPKPRKSRVPFLLLCLLIGCLLSWYSWEHPNPEYLQANAPKTAENAAPVVPQEVPEADRESAAPPSPPTAPESVTQPTDSMAALRQQMEKDEARLKMLEEKISHQGPSSEQASIALQQANQTMALMRTQMGLLQQQLASMQQQATQQGLPVRQLQLWVVLGQLKTALRNGASAVPLVMQLREGWVGDSAEEHDALRRLAEASEAHIPTEESLVQDFAQLKKDVGNGYLRSQSNWWARLKAVLHEHIHLRRIGTAEHAKPASTDPLEKLDDAQAAMDDGDITEAQHIIESLPEHTAFDGWSDAAARWINAWDAIDLLEQSLLETMQSTPLRDSGDFQDAPDNGKDDGTTDGQEIVAPSNHSGA